MILDTASRQLWSSLRTWLRKPQMVVTGLNTRSRYLMPCSLRASRMLVSLKESAKGSPWSRAKRARTSFRVVMANHKCLEWKWRGPRNRRRGVQSGERLTRAGIASYFHYTWQNSARLPPATSPGCQPSRALKLVPFVGSTESASVGEPSPAARALAVPRSQDRRKPTRLRQGHAQREVSESPT